MFDKINIVIGANYGDEGKGLVTDKLCYENRDKKIVNVLFNGGFQRGHTVELLSGQRHVFHHLGSGSYVGADTYFDKDFLIEPFSFIMDKTDFKNVKVMVADANKNAEIRIAEGEAEYMKILQEAYNTPEKADFYNYMRSLDALKASLKGDNKTIILDKDSELARILYGGNLSVPGSGGQE